MGGFSEQCAKAFCTALLRIALADNRRCYIMLFANQIVHYELTAASGIEQAVRFLGQQFRGGTDLAACLNATVTKMAESGWFDADAVIISDFIAQRLPEEVIKKVKQQQQATSSVSMRWRCPPTANPASCASSIISGASIPG